jgi:hypothetical protein
MPKPSDITSVHDAAWKLLKTNVDVQSQAQRVARAAQTAAGPQGRRQYETSMTQLRRTVDANVGADIPGFVPAQRKLAVNAIATTAAATVAGMAANGAQQAQAVATPSAAMSGRRNANADVSTLYAAAPTTSLAPDPRHGSPEELRAASEVLTGAVEGAMQALDRPLPGPEMPGPEFGQMLGSFDKR